MRTGTQRKESLRTFRGTTNEIGLMIVPEILYARAIHIQKHSERDAAKSTPRAVEQWSGTPRADAGYQIRIRNSEHCHLCT
jgi:hypothetical protein